MNVEKLEKLRLRFKYTSDGVDEWHFFRDEDPVWEGDCDDYACNALLALSDGSLWRFWWYVLTFQAVFWIVLSPRRVGHMRLWFKGKWICNIRPEPDSKPAKDMIRLMPLTFPTVALKLLVGKIVHRKGK